MLPKICLLITGIDYLLNCYQNNMDNIFYFLSSSLLPDIKHKDNLINTFYSFSFSVMHSI